MNNNLLLISGKSATGKSMCLRNIKNPEGVIYLNCENNKGLPFRNKFQKFTITDPLQIFEAFDAVLAGKIQGHTLVIDSLTYMMDMYESVHVLPSSNTMKAWGDYGQFFKTLMNQYVAKTDLRVIFTGHTSDIINDDMVMETLVKVKGSLMNTGIESYFSTVLSSKKVSLKNISKYESDLLNISEEEEMLGFKYVFQTKLTKETVNERIRASLGMWDTKETYIDNDVQLVFERLAEYFEEE